MNIIYLNDRKLYVFKMFFVFAQIMEQEDHVSKILTIDNKTFEPLILKQVLVNELGKRLVPSLLT